MSYRIACIVIFLFSLFYWIGFHAVNPKPVTTPQVCNVPFRLPSIEPEAGGHALLDAFFGALLADPEKERFDIIVVPYDGEAEACENSFTGMRMAKWMIDHCRFRYDLPVSRFYIQDIDDSSSSHLPGFAGISLRLKRTGG